MERKLRSARPAPPPALFFSLFQVSVTNDGATILKSVYVDNPAAKVMVDISKTQDAEVSNQHATPSSFVRFVRSLRQRVTLLITLHLFLILKSVLFFSHSLTLSLSLSLSGGGRDHFRGGFVR